MAIEQSIVSPNQGRGFGLSGLSRARAGLPTSAQTPIVQEPETVIEAATDRVVNKSQSFSITEAYNGATVIVDTTASDITVTLPDLSSTEPIRIQIAVKGDNQVFITPASAGNLHQYRSGYGASDNLYLSEGEGAEIILNGGQWLAVCNGPHVGYSYLLSGVTGLQVGALRPGGLIELSATSGFTLNLEGFSQRTNNHIYNFIANLGASGSLTLTLENTPGLNILQVTQTASAVFWGNSYTVDRTKFGATVRIELRRSGTVWNACIWNLPN